jgi:tetratricopeptide (TPR) repeat protein
VTSPAAYKIDQDVVRVKVRAQEFPFPIETFTLLFSNVTNTSCDLALIWDRTLVALTIKTDVDAKIMAQIDKAMGKDSFPYFNAALYYLENKKDLNKALEWFTKAGEQNPTGFFIFYQKARCEAKLGRKTEAIATAQKSIELSKQAKNDDYVALNQKLIASLQ